MLACTSTCDLRALASEATSSYLSIQETTRRALGRRKLVGVGGLAAARKRISMMRLCVELLGRLQLIQTLGSFGWSSRYHQKRFLALEIGNVPIGISFRGLVP